MSVLCEILIHSSLKLFSLIQGGFLFLFLKLGFPKNEPREFCDSPKNNMQKCVWESADTQKFIFQWRRVHAFQ